uniref:X-box-binding protein 1 n=1 Tax=Ciona savignyi TaxID=51511 RepID=H2YQD5_CIOSA
MLMSQFRESSYENFQQVERRVSGQRSPSKVTMSVSSYSTSSSPSSATASVDLGQTFNMENCDGIMLNLENGNAFGGYEHLPTSLESSAMRTSPGIADAGYTNAAGNITSKGMKSTQPVFNQYSMIESMSGYEHSPYASGSPVSSVEVEFANHNSNEVFANDAQSVSTHPQSTTPRKSFEHVTDKELRKKLKNRESAQAARDRKKAKMLSLERQIAELLDRNRIVEAENQELRSRVQRMESESMWRMGKQETVPDASSSFSGSLTYNRIHEQPGYSNHCEYNNYQQNAHVGIRQHHVPPTATEKHSLPAYQNYTDETAPAISDYSQPSYVQNLWRGDTVNTTQAYPNDPFSSQQPKSERISDGIIA